MIKPKRFPICLPESIFIPLANGKCGEEVDKGIDQKTFFDMAGEPV